MLEIRSDTVVILGTGYTGRRVRDLLESHGFGTITTGRTPTEAVLFDLLKPETWSNLPSARGAVWTFPAEPPDIVKTFSELLFTKVDRVVVIGTTSSYIVGHEAEIVTAETRLNVAAPRVGGEEELRHRGAIILRSGGIYGPGRNPLDWVRRGLVRDMEKIVNLVHVDDLAASILAALERGISGSSYVVTDGTPRSWREIVEWGIRQGYLTHPPDPGVSLRPSRRIDNTKLITELHPQLTHLDVFEELRRLEQNPTGAV